MSGLRDLGLAFLFVCVVRNTLSFAAAYKLIGCCFVGDFNIFRRSFYEIGCCRR
jgi:hypothetical protein